MGVNKLVNKAIFLDRDGVLNNAIIKKGKPYPPYKVKDVTFPTNIKRDLFQLKKNGFLLIMITNQPDVSRGKLSLRSLNDINNYVKNQLDIDDVFICIHDDKDNCLCRKPKPGMIINASSKWNIDLTKSFLVGDRWRDIQAGIKIKIKTILIDLEYDEKKVVADYEFKKFSQAVIKILELNKLNK